MNEFDDFEVKADTRPWFQKPAAGYVAAGSLSAIAGFAFAYVGGVTPDSLTSDSVASLPDTLAFAGGVIGTIGGGIGLGGFQGVTDDYGRDPALTISGILTAGSVTLVCGALFSTVAIQKQEIEQSVRIPEVAQDCIDAGAFTAGEFKNAVAALVERPVENGKIQASIEEMKVLYARCP